MIIQKNYLAINKHLKLATAAKSASFVDISGNERK